MYGSDHYSARSGGSMRAVTSAASLPRLLMKPISARQFRGAEIGLDSYDNLSYLIAVMRWYHHRRSGSPR